MIKSPKKNVIINIRVDSDSKASSAEILKKKDIDHSKAFRMLINYIIETNDVPDFMK